MSGIASMSILKGINILIMYLYLSNPIKTKAIASAKIKTDKIDGVQLANLLRDG